MSGTGWGLRRLVATAMLAVLIAVPTDLRAADVEGSRDHPLISRYPGSEITWQDRQEFEPYQIAVGPVTGHRTIDDWKKVEGRITRLNYELIADRSFYEVYSNYLGAAQKAGFAILAQGVDTQSSVKGGIGQRGFLQVHYGANPIPPEASLLLAGSSTSGGSGYFAGEILREQGRAFVVVAVTQQSKDKTVVLVDIIETKAMEQDLVVVNAAAMAKGIDADGKVALYGIYFDQGKASLTAACDPMLEEIARLLALRPDLNAYLVGHTDDVGALNFNYRLSGDRAKAVVATLKQKYGVADGRLEAHGVGALAPVATNKTEAGRAKNRRVELVER